MEFANLFEQHFVKLLKFARYPYFCMLKLKNQTKDGDGSKLRPSTC